jgi:predicted transcriptional regulator of viral defense system
MAEKSQPGWTFLTNHARVLLCIAHDSAIRLRDVGESVGITERAAHRIVTELLAAGYITRTRNGRRNQYTVNHDVPLSDPLARSHNIGELLAILAHPTRSANHSGEQHASEPVRVD